MECLNIQTLFLGPKCLNSAAIDLKNSMRFDNTFEYATFTGNAFK